MASRRLPTEHRRQQIAEAALQILAHEGPGHLTLVALGEAVGIRDASILKHYSDKGAIIDAAIDVFGELIREDLPTDIDDPLERLGVFFVRRAQKLRARPELMALAHNARLADVATRAGLRRLEAHVATTGAFICGCLDEAARGGRLDDRTPTTIWVWIIAGLLRGAAGQLPPGLVDPSELDALAPEVTWAHLRRLMERPGRVRGPRRRGARSR
ncbi:MAG: hypothetical protein RIT81_32510 [Deltaproteobacteria bacterium]